MMTRNSATREEKYIREFIKKLNLGRIVNVFDKGAIKFNVEIENKIKLQQFEKKEIDYLLEKKNFNVGQDDLIKVFELKCEEKDYYIFIYEALELYTSDYYIGLLRIKN